MFWMMMNNVKKERYVVDSNRRSTVQEVCGEAGVSKTSYREILTKNLGMRHVAAKSLPCLLTEDQKQCTLKSGKNFLLFRP
jgi:hypothetical protein